MMIPIRCFSCGKMIADVYEEYQKRVAKREDPEKVLDDLGVTKYCCRRMIHSHVDLADEIMQYKV